MSSSEEPVIRGLTRYLVLRGLYDLRQATAEELADLTHTPVATVRTVLRRDVVDYVRWVRSPGGGRGNVPYVYSPKDAEALASYLKKVSDLLGVGATENDEFPLIQSSSRFESAIRMAEIILYEKLKSAMARDRIEHGSAVDEMTSLLGEAEAYAEAAASHLAGVEDATGVVEEVRLSSVYASITQLRWMFRRPVRASAYILPSHGQIADDARAALDSTCSQRNRISWELVGRVSDTEFRSLAGDNPKGSVTSFKKRGVRDVDVFVWDFDKITSLVGSSPGGAKAQMAERATRMLTACVRNIDRPMHRDVSSGSCLVSVVREAPDGHRIHVAGARVARPSRSTVHLVMGRDMIGQAPVVAAGYRYVCISGAGRDIIRNVAEQEVMQATGLDRFLDP